MPYPMRIKLRPFPQLRQYRFDLPDKTFRILKDRIRCAKDLQKWIDLWHPLNVYESCSTWANPVRIRGYKKSSYKWADKIILSHDVLVDIDLPGQAGLIEVAKTLHFFKSKQDYKLQRILSTGGGYHVIFDDTKQLNITDPEKRFQSIKERRTALKEELLKAGINFDAQVLDDLFRVSRVCGTYNSKRQKFCHEVPVQTIGNVPMIGSVPKIETQPTPLLDTEPNPSLWRFITNKVPGLKDRYVPVFLWNRNVDYKRFLREDLNLGKVYVFNFNNMLQGISTKTVSAARLTKLLYKTRSLNLNSWLKYGHCWFYLGKKQDIPVTYETLKHNLPEYIKKYSVATIANSLGMERPELIDVVDSEQTYFASKPHAMAVGFLTGNNDHPRLLHGGFIKENLVVR